MAHSSFVLLLTHPCIGNQGKKHSNFISDTDYSSCCQWHNTKIKRIFRESIFLWVFEIQVHNNEEIIVTAADVVVEG